MATHRMAATDLEGLAVRVSESAYERVEPLQLYVGDGGGRGILVRRPIAYLVDEALLLPADIDNDAPGDGLNPWKQVLRPLERNGTRDRSRGRLHDRVLRGGRSDAAAPQGHLRASRYLRPHLPELRPITHAIR